MARRLLRGAGVVLACVALYLGVLSCVVYSGRLEVAAPGSMDRGENGVWMAHRWFDDRKFAPLADTEMDRVCETLNACRMRFLYVHVGPLDASGAIPQWDAVRWSAIRDRIRRKMPGVRLLAWIGGVNARFEGQADDTVVLARPDVRARIVREAGRMMEAGFDGIHYDIEPLGDNERPFLSLLEETQAVLTSPRPGLLSAAVPLARPSFTPAVGPLAALWTPAWYRLVSQKCDQVVLMGYDAAQPTAGLYTRFLRWQVRQVESSIECPLIVGLPAYSAEKSRSHDPAVETMEAGLRGLMASGSERHLLGAAVYAEWTARPDEWRTFQETWCSRANSQAPAPRP